MTIADCGIECSGGNGNRGGTVVAGVESDDSGVRGESERDRLPPPRPSWSSSDQSPTVSPSESTSLILAAAVAWTSLALGTFNLTTSGPLAVSFSFSLTSCALCSSSTFFVFLPLLPLIFTIPSTRSSPPVLCSIRFRFLATRFCVCETTITSSSSSGKADDTTSVAWSTIRTRSNGAWTFPSLPDASFTNACTVIPFVPCLTSLIRFLTDCFLTPSLLVVVPSKCTRFRFRMQ